MLRRNGKWPAGARMRRRSDKILAERILPSDSADGSATAGESAQTSDGSMFALPPPSSELNMTWK
jgi:hypothetical protein